VSTRRARGDRRVDVALVAVAVLCSIIALAMPQARAERTAGLLRRTAFAPLLALQQRAERARRAIADHDSVTRAGDSVVMRAREADRLVDENTQLRALLSLRERISFGSVAADALHGPQLGEEHTLVLTAGTDAGVEPFSPIVTADGVVGYVRSADARTSVAIVWPHPDFRVSSISADTNAFGIVSAHLDGSGGARFLLEMRGVPYRTPLDSGTMIVSSGFGGTFPRGIPVGTVLGELPNESGWERRYLILPAVRPAAVGSVLVLTNSRGSRDVGAAWATASDSAGRQP